jgi:hypothetical protein
MAGAGVKGTRTYGAVALAALLGAIALLVPASPALAGYQNGLYEGTTEQEQKVSFRAGEWRVKRFQALLFAECKNGERQRISIENGRTAIEEDRFELELTGATELEVKIVGRLREDSAVGRIEASVRPPGTVCADTVRWHADHL